MANMAYLKEKEEEELIIVEDKNLLTHDDYVDDAEDRDDEDSRPKEKADDADAEAGSDDADDTDEGREDIRERRRKEKADRKDRRDQAIKRDKTELDFLRKQNEDLEIRVRAQEQRAHAVDISGFDQAIEQAKQDASRAQNIMADAINSGNGDDAAMALQYRDEAIARANNLSFRKQQASQTSYTPAQPQMDDRVRANAQKFMSDNPWYDRHGRNEDSAIVLVIDRALAKDGYDPKNEDYWEELKNRVSRRLPERFTGKDAKAPRSPRGGPNVGSGREHAPSSTRKEVYISEARKKALVEAGVWDDPVLRNRYVKRYVEYDSKNKS
jgi:hypothetical protein